MLLVTSLKVMAQNSQKIIDWVLRTVKKILILRYLFLQYQGTRDQRTPWWLPLCISWHTSFIFFSPLNKCHHDKGTWIEWRGLPSPKYVVMWLLPTTYLPCILQQFWITLWHVCICSSQNQTLLVLWWCHRPTCECPILCYSSVKGNFMGFENS